MTRRLLEELSFSPLIAACFHIQPWQQAGLDKPAVWGEMGEAANPSVGRQLLQIAESTEYQAVVVCNESYRFARPEIFHRVFLDCFDEEFKIGSILSSPPAL